MTHYSLCDDIYKLFSEKTWDRLVKPIGDYFHHNRIQIRNETCEKFYLSVKNRPVITTDLYKTFSYNYQIDRINIPTNYKLFKSKYSFYRCLFHELIHSTGHSSRLNRFTIEKWKLGLTDLYREECIAEIGSLMICNHCGIKDFVFKESTKYISSFLEFVNYDRNQLLSEAIYEAEKAYEFILNSTKENKNE